jgi:hypothetical protein
LRINLRAKIKGYTLFFMFAQTQKLIGVTSKVVKEKDKHYVFWDLEKCTLEQAKKELLQQQKIHELSDIFITSDFPNSFRAWCFTKVSFKELLDILLHTKYVDWNFFYWTVQKGKATLRISEKKNRPQQKIVAILKDTKNYSEEWQQLEEKKIVESHIPLTKLERVDYETGTDKIGIFKKFDFDKNQTEER